MYVQVPPGRCCAPGIPSVDYLYLLSVCFFVVIFIKCFVYFLLDPALYQNRVSDVFVFFRNAAKLNETYNKDWNFC